MRSITASLIVLACELNPSAAPAQSPDIDQLMHRVGTYVQSFVETFSNVVAEERYEPRDLRQFPSLQRSHRIDNRRTRFDDSPLKQPHHARLG